MRKRSLIKKIQALNPRVRGAFWFTAATFFQNGISLIAAPIFSRIFSLEEAGTYSLYLTWYSIFSVVSSLNVSGAAFNALMHDCQDEKQERKLLFNSAILSIFSSFLILFSYGVFSFFGFNFSGLTFPLFLMIALSIFIDVPVKLYIAYSKYRNSFLKCSLLMMIQSLLSFSMALGLIFLFSNRVFGRIIGKEAGYIVIFFVSLFYIFQKKYLKIDWKEIWKVFLVVFPLIFHYIAADALSQADRIILNEYQGVSVVGIYSLTYSVVALFITFIGAFDSVFSPWLLKKIDGKEKEKVFQVTLPFFLFMFFATSCVSFIAKEVILLFGGSKYLPGVQTLPILLISVYFIMLYSFVAGIEFYYKKTWLASIFTVIAAIANIFFDLWLVPKYSMIGAAIGTVCSYGIMTIFHLISSEVLSRKKLLISNFFHCEILGLICLAGTAVLVFSYFIYDYLILRWILFFVFLISAVVVVVVKRKKISLFIFSRGGNEAIEKCDDQKEDSPKSKPLE
jgi:O-antigen/teichoic acid export membrane protein